MTSPILLVGFGNTLMADDGAGPAVVARLRALGPPALMRVEEGDGDSLRLVSLWRGEPSVWLVDAVIRGAAPGTIHRVGHNELLAVPQRHATVHHLSLPESLRWLALGYPEMAGIRYRLWGIEPACVHPHPELSGPVTDAVERVAGELLDEARSAPL
jgi:hydrogenase maturation protease